VVHRVPANAAIALHVAAHEIIKINILEVVKA
jgi:hypothetical protein